MLLLLAHFMMYSQTPKTLFRSYRFPDVPDNKFGEILVAGNDQVFVSSSDFSFLLITGGNVGVFTFGLDNQDYGIKNLESVFSGSPIKTITGWKQGNIFFSTAKNQITYFRNNNDELDYCDIPPFYFPIKGDGPKEITKLWTDSENNLFIGVIEGAFYMVAKAGDKNFLDKKNYQIGRANDSSMAILKGELPVKKIVTEAGVHSFGENRTNKDIIWIGSGKGLLQYNKATGDLATVSAPGIALTITHIEPFANGDVWFSTLEKGMGVYHQLNKTFQFFPYPLKITSTDTLFPIQDFCVKSKSEFFVALKDSLPAIFNVTDGSYKFIDDPSFELSKNNTTDIRIDNKGTFYFIKGGLLYSANINDNPEWKGSDTTGISYKPIIYGVTDFKRREISNFLTHPEFLEKLKLKYNENSIIIYLTTDYHSQNKKTQFAWRLDGDINNWVEMPAFVSDNDSSSIVELPDIRPGKYVFRAKVRIGTDDWSKEEAKMEINFVPPYWTTWWFWTSIAAGICLIVYTIVKLRVSAVRRTERLKASYQKELLELEAKALRAQMNPHFVFNSLNSIKALMQQNQNEKGVTYLTTFSKLIRTLFNNADKKEITLYDEIETCKFYLQLEAMRFDDKFSYSVQTDDVDLKSICVPALIVQPFIENAIWHGIIPRGAGRLSVTVSKKNDEVQIVIDDDGIGREISEQSKSANAVIHQSKGVKLTHSRLKLDSLLQQRKASIETIDKKDENGKATGTRVVLTIIEEI
jgi:hypothetical protein